MQETLYVGARPRAAGSALVPEAAPLGLSLLSNSEREPRAWHEEILS